MILYYRWLVQNMDTVKRKQNYGGQGGNNPKVKANRHYLMTPLLNLGKG